jgi:hypothetical protein
VFQSGKLRGGEFIRSASRAKLWLASSRALSPLPHLCSFVGDLPIFDRTTDAGPRRGQGGAGGPFFLERSPGAPADGVRHREFPAPRTRRPIRAPDVVGRTRGRQARFSSSPPGWESTTARSGWDHRAGRRALVWAPSSNTSFAQLTSRRRPK